MEKKHRDRNKIIEIKKTFKRPKIVQKMMKILQEYIKIE